MSKFAKQAMATMEGVEIFPLVSLLIFFSFFMLLGLYVWKRDKQFYNQMSELPLNNDQTQD
jgi:cytochrome c oxidase cbb3-type subunit IV